MHFKVFEEIWLLGAYIATLILWDPDARYRFNFFFPNLKEYVFEDTSTPLHVRLYGSKRDTQYLFFHDAMVNILDFDHSRPM